MENREIMEALAAAVPFNRYLGLEYASIEPGSAEVRLIDREQHRNHVGTLHAGALFTVAEAASGAAFVSAFAPRLAEVVPVVESAEIHFSAPARGTIAAHARMTKPADALLVELDRDGRTRPPIEVRLVDESGREVASMTVLWNMKLRKAR